MMKLALVALFAVISAMAQVNGAGKQVFEGNCAACHGADGNGGEFAPGIVTRIVNRPDPDIKTTVLEGLPTRGMPPVKLSEKELADLLPYLRSLNPPRRGDMAAVPVTINLADGKQLRGTSVNRTFEDMQVRSPDGRIHLLRKQGEKYREVTSQVDWPSYDGDLKGNRFSPVKLVDRKNVNRMTPKWIYSINDTVSLETTPIVVEGVMYVTTTNECYALDAGSGREVWRYHRSRTKELGSKVNRGAAISGSRVFMVTDNAHLIALDRSTGELLWETEMADSHHNYAATSAPLIVGDLVVAGTAGGDGGVRGFLCAYDQKTGKETWRVWTIPDKGQPGSETWNGKSNVRPAGGATWFTGSYDHELGTLYWQVGNPGPDHNGDEREGDNLYSDSVIALDAKTGTLKWHYQFTPHDEWDWDAAEPLTLVDAKWEGQDRKLLLQANRNGFFYVIDRTTGKLLLGKPFVKTTWAKEIDAKGRPVRLADVSPTVAGTRVCPAVLGAANWWSTAFDPASSLYYVQVIESCGVYTKGQTDWQAGRGFMGGSSKNAPGMKPQRFLRAIDIRTGKMAWELPEIGSGESRSGALATAGGLVFFGEDSGSLMAADSANGKILWHFQTSQSIRSSPMTYVFDRKQYVVLASGSNILVFGVME